MVTKVDGMVPLPRVKGEPLDGAWEMALEQAWEAIRTGSTPVGAVVASLDGTVVAAERGRRYEAAGPSGQLAGTHIAHAEVNALAQLGSSRHWDDHMLLTTLEPCGMCHGAAVRSTLSRLVFVAPEDPYGGTAAMSFDNPQSRRRPLVVEGPLPDQRGAFATLLQTVWLLERPSAGHVVAEHYASLPKLTECARAVRADLLAAAADGDYAVELLEQGEDVDRRIRALTGHH